MPLLACGILLASCGRKLADSTTAAATAGSPQPRILRVGNGDEPQSLDPQVINGDPEHRVVMALMEGLLGEDPKDLRPVPGTAQSWDISPDGLTYTFHLRPNLRWSNGDAIVADDYVQSYKRALNPVFASPYAYLIFNYVPGAEDFYKGRTADFSKVGIRAPDGRTLVISLMHPVPYLLKVIANHWIWDALPIRAIAKLGALDRRDNPWTKPGNYVGNGPYLLKEWLPQQKIVVARNPYYWDAASVKSDQIEFYPIQDNAAEERMFRTGELDATYTLPLSKIDVYRREHPDELHLEPLLATYYYQFNVTRPPFTDKRVRRALAMAIDREGIVRDVTRGGQRPAYAMNYPGTAGYTARARLIPDLAEARRLLAEAGYPGGKGLPPIELLYNTQANHVSIAEAIQSMWRENLGVEITLQNEEWKVYEDATQHHNFQIARAGWIADYVDPQALLEIFASGSENNFTLWSNPQFDRLLHAALAAGDSPERYEDYQKMDAILVDECPIIPLYYYTFTYALSPKVRGWYPVLLNNHPWKFVYVER